MPTEATDGGTVPSIWEVSPPSIQFLSGNTKVPSKPLVWTSGRPEFCEPLDSSNTLVLEYTLPFEAV